MSRMITRETLLDRSILRPEDQRHYTDDDVLLMALHLERNGLQELAFVADLNRDLLEQLKHTRVTIKAGTRVTGPFPDSVRDKDERGEPLPYRTYKRDTVIAVHDVYPGWIDKSAAHHDRWAGRDAHRSYLRPPQIVYVGAGGYWHHVDANLVPEAVELVRNALTLVRAAEPATAGPHDEGCEP